MRAEPNRIAAALGVVAVVFNGLGVLFLNQVSEAYRPGVLDRWYFSALQHDSATSWSAWCFTAGVLLLVPWVAGMARSIGPYAWPGAGLVAMGAMANASGSLLPFVVVTHLPHGEEALGQTLLGIALTMDALFNLVFGFGLVLLNIAMARAVQFPMWLSGFGLLAGMMTMGAFGEAWSPVAADFVLLAGPIWLIWVTTACVVLYRLPAYHLREPDARSANRADQGDGIIRPSSGRADPFLPQPAK